MKLIKTKIGSLYRNISGGDLLDSKIDYEVTKAKGELNYKGPKIPPEVWWQIVSFLKWANDTAHSEAQVRLFVSTKNNTWKAWAFPQKGHGGLSSEEIQDEEFQKQRAALFEKDDEWDAWGTVHSHANVSAFQSSTDEADEENQGGLHITVGNLSDGHYTFHARLYHQKDMYEPDMSKFWDIGDPYKGLTPDILFMLPEMADDKLARIQMCVPHPVEFPEQWKTNYRKPPERLESGSGQGHLTRGQMSEIERWHEQKRLAQQDRTFGLERPYYLRLRESVEELIDYAVPQGAGTDEIRELLEEMDDVLTSEVVSICKQYGVMPGDMLGELNRLIIKGEEKPTPSGDGNNNGFVGSDDHLNYGLD